MAQSYYARAPQLPEPIQRHLLDVAARSQEILDFLRETTTEKPSASPARFASLLGERLSISVSEAQRLLNVLQNLQLIDQETGDHDKTFAFIGDRLPPEMREKWNAARTIMISILEVIDADHPAIISQKAHRLSFLYERIFMGAEIITDLRPIYTIKGDKILEMIIQHKLVITQHDADHDNSDIHFVMDARDVINLKNACDRAVQKAKVLQDSLGNLPWVTELLSEDEQT